MDRLTPVWALIGTVTGICSVRASAASARETAERFNADPFLEPDMPDADAPYRVEKTTLEEIERSTGHHWGVAS